MSERDIDIDERNAGAVGMAQQLLSDDGSGVMGPGPCADAQAEWRRMTAALSTAEREREALRDVAAEYKSERDEAGRRITELVNVLHQVRSMRDRSRINDVLDIAIGREVAP